MFSNLNRKEIRSDLTSTEFDVLVIGGGITGAGIALDATTRGMKVALIEMQDFAAGTSSRSTKLVHGGLRYLKQLDFKLVSEVGKERRIVYENGPHVTKPEWMLLPIHKGGTFGKYSTSLGLWAYDYLADVSASERRVMLSREQTLQKEPLLKKEGLLGGGYYVEYRTDDARLTLEVLKAAVAKGATALNYAKAEVFLYENRKIVGVQARDLLNKQTFKLTAKKVINATGPWVDRMREQDGSKHGASLVLTKGVHIVIDAAKFPLKQAVYFDTKSDQRMIFAIPRDRKVYVGTTDTFYDEDPVAPIVTKADRIYLLEAISYMFPEVKLSLDEIESTWAGVRPLILEEGKGPSEISRKDEIWTSDSGLISIAGGKLTGYRKMAETIVDLVASQLRQQTGHHFRSCQTKGLPISGGEFCGPENFKGFVELMTEQGMTIGLSEREAAHLASFYGSNVSAVFDLLDRQRQAWKDSELPTIVFAKLLYGVFHEMVATPLDFYARRTGELLFSIDAVKSTEARVVQFMGDTFNWQDEEKTRHLLELEAELDARGRYEE